MKLEIISKFPSGTAHPTPLLFVHGAWHGAWCWDAHFLDYFSQRGYEVHALNLRGHGESEGRDKLRWHRVADYVADVVQVASQLSRPPVVIGHSLGGHVVQKYLESHPAPGGVLLASLPAAGLLASTVRTFMRQPLAMIKANLTLRMYPLVASPEIVRRSFFSAGLSDEQVVTYWKQMQDESAMAFLDMLMFDLPKPDKVKAPMLVLGGALDQLFHPYEVEATARAYNAPCKIFEGVAHDMMLEPGWQAVADHILAWLKDR